MNTKQDLNQSLNDDEIQELINKKADQNTKIGFFMKKL